MQGKTNMSSTKKKWIIVLAVVMVLLVAAYKVVSSPVLWFELRTGLDIPSSAQVLSHGDTHGWFADEGEFHVIFEVDDATIEKFLAEKPPWNKAAWTPGPARVVKESRWPFVIVGITRKKVQCDYRGQVPQLRQICDSAEAFYVSRQRPPLGVLKHRGDMLFLDVRQNRVMYSSWDAYERRRSCRRCVPCPAR